MILLPRRSKRHAEALQILANGFLANAEAGGRRRKFQVSRMTDDGEPQGCGGLGERDLVHVSIGHIHDVPRGQDIGELFGDFPRLG
jgi:hypothetical protein